MTDTSNLRPLDFGEIFSRGFELTRRTFSNAGVITIGTLVILNVIAGLLMQSMFSTFGTAMSTSGNFETDPEASRQLASSMFSVLAGFIPLMLLALLAYPFMITACATAGWEATNDNDISIGELIGRSFGKPMWYLVAMAFLLFVAMFVASFALGLISIPFVAILGNGGRILVSLAYYAGAFYVLVSISMAAHKVIVEGRGPIKGLQASFELVKGNWWRLFAMLVLLVIGYYAVLIVLMLVFAGTFFSTLSSFASLASMSRNDPAVIGSLFASLANAFPIWLFVLFGAVGGAFVFVATNMLTAAYTDFRARRGEFEETGDELDMV